MRQIWYESGPATCPYLPDLEEKKLFTLLPQQDCQSAIELNHKLTQEGFRRSDSVMYRPNCKTCNACQPLRILVKKFKPSSTFQRILTKNKDLVIEIQQVSQIKSDSEFRNLYDLLQKYLTTRHHDSEMSKMSYTDFIQFIAHSPHPEHTYLLTAYSNNLANKKLKACMIFDRYETGVSAIYHFFASVNTQRSLGTYLILKLVEYAKNSALNYLYMGYYVKDSPKMNYKDKFKPHEIWQSKTWC